MEEKCPSEIVEAALTALEDKGWCKKQFVDNDGRMCILGAVEFASQEQGITTQFGSLARHAIRRQISTGIISWNDKIERTFEDVREVLTNAAKSLRNEGM